MKKLYYSLLLAAFIQPALAEASLSPEALNIAREQVVVRYLQDLAKADAADIATLFTEEGIVMSTSRGKARAKEFFLAFLPQVTTASTELHQTFSGKTDANRYAARFHLDYRLKDGETGNGEYMDEFVFEANSTQLNAIYMFENLKFTGKG